MFQGPIMFPFQVQTQTFFLPKLPTKTRLKSLGTSAASVMINREDNSTMKASWLIEVKAIPSKATENITKNGWLTMNNW